MSVFCESGSLAVNRWGSPSDVLSPTHRSSAAHGHSKSFGNRDLRLRVGLVRARLFRCHPRKQQREEVVYTAWLKSRALFEKVGREVRVHKG